MKLKSLLAQLLAAACVLFVASYAIAEEPAPFKPDADGKVVIFNGKDFAGWDADPKFWSIDNGEIVGQVKGNHGYDYLCTQHAVGDFRLILQIKLTPNSENSGIQFRSVRLKQDEMKGPQADVGKGWWGHLYEEHGRGLLTKKSGEQFVKENDWNTYEVLAVGGKIRTAINGHVCTDIDDDKVAKSGIIGFQIHAGGTMEVRFRELKLELNPKFEMATVEKEAK
jgi:hypothetical protein